MFQQAISKAEAQIGSKSSDECELSMSHSNRATVFFAINLHQSSILDLDRAIHYCRNGHYRTKLLLRKLFQLISVSKFGESRDLISHLADQHLDPLDQELLSNLAKQLDQKEGI